MVSPASQSLHVAGFGCVRNGRVLLRHINFELASGQLLLLQGGNGTGKSTLLRSMAGLMHWRAGTLRWCGHVMSARNPLFQQQLAYLGHQCAMHDALSGAENLRYALQLQGIAWQAERAHQVLQQLQVLHVAQRPLGRLSQGQRRRMALARVLLSDRPLWLLDEPDNALDVDGSALLAQILAAHAQAGGMAVVVSHRGIATPDVPCQILNLNPPSSALQREEGACLVL